VNENVPRITGFQSIYKGPGGTLPDFLLIGAQKCGTTTLYDLLVTHPNIHPAYQKEVHYFDRYYNKGLIWYRANMPRRSERRAAEKRGEPFLTGEAAPSYIYHPLAAERAHRLLPGAKLVVLLRNPVERAFSHYHKEIGREDETLSFEEAIAQEEMRLEGKYDKVVQTGNHSHNWWHYSYKNRGHYAEQLQRWYKLYPRENFLILKTEDMAADTPGTVNEVCRFLGIEENKITDFPRSNVGGYGKEMDRNTRAQLEDYFRPHNQKLYELINRDMGW
jgi:hypothetical protein